MSSFRLRGRSFLVTWSTVDLEHVTVFKLLDDYSPIKRAVLARELHQDLQPHFHAYVEFERQLDRSLSRQWDLDGQHPNVSPKRHGKERRSAAEYCRKGDDWIEFGDWDDEENATLAPTELARECVEWGEFLDRAYSEGIPFAYAKAAWDHIRTIPPRTWFEGEIQEGEIHSRDLRDLDFTPDDGLALILHGPTNLGKTSWAIQNAPKPLLVCCHLEDIAYFRAGHHQAILFDDLVFTHMPRSTQLGLVDFHNDRTIHVRYKVIRIPAKLPKIFTCNPGFYPVDVNDPAIARRINIFDCN